MQRNRKARSRTDQLVRVANNEVLSEGPARRSMAVAAARRNARRSCNDEHFRAGSLFKLSRRGCDTRCIEGTVPAWFPIDECEWFAVGSHVGGCIETYRNRGTKRGVGRAQNDNGSITSCVCLDPLCGGVPTRERMVIIDPGRPQPGPKGHCE